MAKNFVLEGDYKGKALLIKNGFKGDKLFLGPLGFFKNLEINRESLESYEVITEEISKSAASGVARGLVGGALLGPVGLLAGTFSAKNKGTYNIILQFKDGKKSLVEVDEKIYKLLIRIMF